LYYATVPEEPLLKTHSRERLFIHSDLWTTRHLELLSVVFVPTKDVSGKASAPWMSFKQQEKAGRLVRQLRRCRPSARRDGAAEILNILGFERIP
jgi:hypothetical protein